MLLRLRLIPAAKVAALHLLLSVVIALLVGGWVFSFWYPAPMQEIAGGAGLFLILVMVHMVCGPLLTLVLFDPSKTKRKWVFDLGLISSIQLTALIYGLSLVAAARPVFVALEGDRFRVVQAMNVDRTRLEEAPPELRALSLTGPIVISVRLVEPGTPEFLASVQLSAQGLHPAFRPSRWQSYKAELPGLLQRLMPIPDLRHKNPGRIAELDQALTRLAKPEEALGYLPLVRDEITDWVVLVQRSDGTPVAYLNLDGW